MARPITWQDVSAPRGLAVAVEAFGRGGDRLAQAVGNIGQVAEDYRNDQIKLATDAAVAGIANSDDPTGAASALPKDWTIDPLAVAVAANARKDQLGNIAVRESGLATDKLQREATQAELTDREDKRMGAVAAQKGFAFIDKTGRIPEFEADDPLAGTQAGLYAQEAWREHLKQKQSYDLDKDRLGLERANAARAARMEAQDRNKQAYIAELNEKALDPQYLGMEPGDRSRLNMEIARKHNVGFLALEGDAHFSNALKSNLPSQAQLDTVDANGFRRSDVISGFQLAKSDIDAKKNADLAQFTVAKEVALQSANSPYKGLTEDQMQNKFLTDHQKELSEGWWGSDWEAKDVGQRADAIQRLAEKKNLKIARHDAIEMVAATIGNMSFADGQWTVKGDNVDALITRYGEFAKYGSVENLQLTIAQREQQAATEAAKVDQAITGVLRSAVTGEPVKAEIAKQYEKLPGAQATRLKSEVETLKAVVADKTMIPYGTKGRDEAISRAQRQLMTAQDRLKRLEAGNSQ